MVIKKEVTFFQNGTIIIKFINEAGQLHRINGPAYIKIIPGVCRQYKYYIHDVVGRARKKGRDQASIINICENGEYIKEIKYGNSVSYRSNNNMPRCVHQISQSTFILIYNCADGDISITFDSQSLCISGGNYFRLYTAAGVNSPAYKYINSIMSRRVMPPEYIMNKIEERRPSGKLSETPLNFFL